MLSNTIYDYWDISCTVSHMKSTKDIDLRSYYVTFHLKSSNDFECIQTRLYDFVKEYKRENYTKKTPLELQPGLCSYLDYDGSKDSIVTKNLPHVHAVLITSKIYNLNDRVDFINAVTNFLILDSAIDNNVKNSVQVTRYDRRKGTAAKDFANVFNYSSKRNSRKNSYTQHNVLPYFDIINVSSNEKLIIKIKNKADIIFNDLKNETNLFNYFKQKKLGVIF